MARPRFITLEGGEGAGKSTQLTLLQRAFAQAEISVKQTREPGGSPGGELIRKLVVEGAVDRWHPVSEALLFMAARYDHIETIIKPALRAGFYVLCDRFYDSTYVYQGLAKQVGGDWLDGLYSQLYGNFSPDLTLYLDIEPAIGLKRTQQRETGDETRFESMDMAFHEQLRAGFLSRVKQQSQRMLAVNANQEVAALHAEIVRKVNEAFSLTLQTVL